MENRQRLRAASSILIKARALGACLAGFADVASLKGAPSFTFAPKMPGIEEGVGAMKNAMGLGPGEVSWPHRARTLLVIAVAHPADRPEMDWWHGRKDPPGNRMLARRVRELCTWISERFGIRTVHLPYHTEKGGTFLKDAAVMAGLGCLGRNNMLVTPEYGPRVRLRALTLDVALPSTGPSAFDPCTGCDAPCRRACPQSAFAQQCYTAEAFDQTKLPGRSGVYSRPACNLQMQKDEASAAFQAVEGMDEPVRVVKYCRNCELACPVGQ